MDFGADSEADFAALLNKYIIGWFIYMLRYTRSQRRQKPIIPRINALLSQLEQICCLFMENGFTTAVGLASLFESILNILLTDSE